MGKNIYVPHSNRDTVEFASREREKSKPGIRTLLPFLKNITEESDLVSFQDLIVASDAFYWLHKVILGGDFMLLRRFYVLFGLYVYFYLRAKEICSSYLDLLK